MNTTIGPNQGPLPGQLTAFAPQSSQQTAATTTTTTSTELPPAQYLTLAFARTTFETLGLDFPNNPEDTAAILSTVQQALDKTVDESRNRRTESLAGSLRSAFTGWAGKIGQMDELHTQFVALEASRDTKKAERDQKIVDRDAKIQQSASLQTQIDAKNGQISDLNGQISTLNGQISSLNTAIAAAQAAGNPALVASLTAQRDAKVGQRDSTQQTLNATIAQRDSLVQQKQTVDAQIVQLNIDIDRLATEIAELETQMDETAQQYFLTKDAIIAVFAPLALALGGLANSDTRTNAARDAVLARLFENLSDQVDEFGESRLRELGQAALLEDLAKASLELLDKDANAQARVLAAAVGLVAGLVDVLTTLSRLENAEADRTGLDERNGRLQLSIG